MQIERGPESDGPRRELPQWAAIVGAVLGVLAVLIVAFVVFHGGDADADVVGEVDAADETSTRIEQNKTSRRDLTAAEREDLDTFVDDAVADLVAFWSEAFPALYGTPYQQLADVFPHRPGGPEPISCGGELRPDQLQSSALYCTDGDYVTWDSSILFPNLFSRFGKPAVGVVLAHEWGHAIQFRADVEITPLVRELQADCYSGAWIRRGLDGSGPLQTSDDEEPSTLDVSAAAAGLLLVRDPAGAPISGRQDHGSVFDRMLAFREGVEKGEAHCGTYERHRPSTVELVLDADESITGYSSYDAAVEAVLADLDEYWGPALLELGVGRTLRSRQFSSRLSCETADVAEFMLYCVPSHQLEWNSRILRDMHRTIGRFAPGFVLAKLYGEVLVAETGGDDPLGLVADCLAGAWAGDVAYSSTRSLTYSTSDLDEALVALLNEPDRTEATTFDRLRAFEVGFFDGDLGTLDSMGLCSTPVTSS